MPPYPYPDDDDWDYPYQRRRSPSTHRRSAYLAVDPRYGASGLQRTRSQGHAPTPIVNIYNDQVQDHYARTSVSPGRTPPYSPSPERRGRRRLGDELVDDLAEMQLMGRSRSRGRSDASHYARSDYSDWQYRESQREQEEERKRKLWEKEAELKAIKKAAEEKAAAEAAKKNTERAIAEYEERKRKAAEDAKLEEIRIKEKIEREKREAKEKEEREWAEFLRKQEEKKKADAAAKAAEEAKLQHEMRRRLEALGYSQATIDIMVDEEKAKKYKERHGRSPPPAAGSTELDIFRPKQKYYKVHRDYLELNTLKYYAVPYEIDPYDPDFFIILREMDKYETEVLFEHTRRLRSGKLLLEAPKEKQYAFFRKPARSKSRGRGKVVAGIIEYK